MTKGYMDILKKRGLQLATVVIVFVVCIFFSQSHISDTFEYKLYDYYLNITADRGNPSDNIVLVLLDQESLNWAQNERNWSWPWPRNAYGELLEFFSLAKSKAVCFDVLFSEESVYGAQDDKAFAESSKNYGAAVQAIHFKKNPEKNGQIDSTNELDNFSIETQPINIIRDSARLCASVMSVTDADGVVRRARLGVPYNDAFFPTLGISPLFIQEGFSNTTADVTEIIQKYQLPLLKDDTIYLRYHRSIDKHIPYNASQILQSLDAIKNGNEPLLEPELFEDCVIFFGFYAPGLFDLVSTPLQKNYPGVGVHVTLLDTILNNSFIREVPYIIEVFALALAIILSSIILKIAQSKRQGQTVFLLKIFFFFVINVSIFFLGSLVLFYCGFYLKTTTILLGIVLSFLVSLSISYTTEGKQRRYLKKAFSQYVSTAVVEELIANPEKLKLGGERRELTMFFSDLQGFTTISENLEPQELTALLNDFLSLMSDVILKSGGTIDKYEGDAIIAFWNAPVEVQNHAAVALEAALTCQNILSAHEQAFTKRTGGRPLKMRIGINTGIAVVGNMGSNNRFDYTMLGDAVNLSSRLEGINKLFGTYTLCSEATKNACEKATDKIRFREIGRIAVVGKSQAVTVYEPFFTEDYKAHETTYTQFKSALDTFYEGDLDKAVLAFSSLNDPVAQKYKALCERYVQEGITTEQGIIRATEK